MRPRMNRNADRCYAYATFRQRLSWLAETHDLRDSRGRPVVRLYVLDLDRRPISSWLSASTVATSVSRPRARWRSGLAVDLSRP